MSTIFSPGGTVVSEAFSNQLTFNFTAVQVVPSSSGNLILSVSPTAQYVEGVSKVIKIPHGNATGIAAESLAALNITGDGFDSSHDMEIAVGYNGGRVWGTIRDVGVAPASAPTIISAEIDTINTPSVMTVTFSAAMYLPNLSSLSLSFSVGTARTISSMASGNGTSVVVFNLSGNVSQGDVFNLVIGSGSNIQDILGNTIAAVSFPVHLASEPQDLPTCVFSFKSKAGSEVNLTGSNIDSLVDRSLVGTVAYSGTGHKPTWISSDTDGTPSVNFDGSVGGSEQWFTIDAPPIDIRYDFIICFLVKFGAAPGGFYNQLLSIDDAAGNGFVWHQRDDLDTAEMGIAGSHPSFQGPSLDNNWHFVTVYRRTEPISAHGSVWGCQVDLGTAVEADFDGTYPGGSAFVSPVGIGAYLKNGVFSTLATTGKLKAMAMYPRYLTTAEIQFVRDSFHADFSICP